MDYLTPKFTTHYMSEKVIVDPHAYTEKVTYRAVAVVVDQRRPNKVKPIFKLKKFVTRTPCIFRVAGEGLLVHPEIYERLRRKMAQDIEEQNRKLFMSTLSASEIDRYHKMGMDTIMKVYEEFQNKLNRK